MNTENTTPLSLWRDIVDEAPAYFDPRTRAKGLVLTEAQCVRLGVALELQQTALAAEIEACAQACDAQAEREPYGHAKHAAVMCAEAVRERAAALAAQQPADELQRLQALVQRMQRVLLSVRQDWRDGHGGEFEDGEMATMDAVRAVLDEVPEALLPVGWVLRYGALDGFHADHPRGLAELQPFDTEAEAMAAGEECGFNWEVLPVFRAAAPAVPAASGEQAAQPDPTVMQYLALTDAMHYEAGPQLLSPEEYAAALHADSVRLDWLTQYAIVQLPKAPAQGATLREAIDAAMQVMPSKSINGPAGTTGGAQ